MFSDAPVKQDCRGKVWSLDRRTTGHWTSENIVRLTHEFKRKHTECEPR